MAIFKNHLQQHTQTYIVWEFEAT